MESAAGVDAADGQSVSAGSIQRLPEYRFGR